MNQLHQNHISKIELLRPHSQIKDKAQESGFEKPPVPTRPSLASELGNHCSGHFIHKGSNMGAS